MPPLMTMPQKRADRLKMIELAMREKAPRMYQTLKRSGSLGLVVESREEEMMAAYEARENDLRDRWLNRNEPDFLKHIRDYETGTREIWEQVLSVFLEFEDTANESLNTA